MASILAITNRLEKDSSALLRTLAFCRSRPKTLVNALAFNHQFKERSRVVQPGIFTKLRRSEAAWNYLFLSGIPQTTNQITVALQKGRVKTKAKDDYKATYSCLYSGSERGKFRRFGIKHWTIG